MKISKRVRLESSIDLEEWAVLFFAYRFKLGRLTTIYGVSFLCFSLELRIAPKPKFRRTKHTLLKGSDKLVRECPEGRLYRWCDSCVDRGDCNDASGK